MVASALAALVETRALLAQSAANTEQWRKVCEAARNDPPALGCPMRSSQLIGG